MDDDPDFRREAQQLYERASALKDEGLLDAAEETIRHAIALEDRPLYQVLLGRIFQKRDQHEVALRILHDACERDDNPLFRAILGHSLYHLGRYEELVECHQRIPVEERRASMLNVLGLGLLSCGRTTEGLATLRQAIERDPTFEEPMYNLAVNLIGSQEEDLEECERLLREAVRRDRRQAHYRRELGRVLAMRGRNDEAEETLRIAVRLDPKDSIAYRYLGLHHSLRGSPAQAEKMYRRALELDPEVDFAAEELVELLESQQRWDEALQVRERFGVTDTEPED